MVLMALATQPWRWLLSAPAVNRIEVPAAQRHGSPKSVFLRVRAATLLVCVTAMAISPVRYVALGQVTEASGSIHGETGGTGPDLSNLLPTTPDLEDSQSSINRPVNPATTAGSVAHVSGASRQYTFMVWDTIQFIGILQNKNR
jgi:hypothetical protein